MIPNVGTKIYLLTFFRKEKKIFYLLKSNYRLILIFHLNASLPSKGGMGGNLFGIGTLTIKTSAARQRKIVRTSPKKLLFGVIASGKIPKVAARNEARTKTANI